MCFTWPVDLCTDLLSAQGLFLSTTSTSYDSYTQSSYCVWTQRALWKWSICIYLCYCIYQIRSLKKGYSQTFCLTYIQGNTYSCLGNTLNILNFLDWRTLSVPYHLHSLPCFCVLLRIHRDLSADKCHFWEQIIALKYYSFTNPFFSPFQREII